MLALQPDEVGAGQPAEEIKLDLADHGVADAVDGPDLDGEGDGSGQADAADQQGIEDQRLGRRAKQKLVDGDVEFDHESGGQAGHQGRQHQADHQSLPVRFQIGGKQPPRLGALFG